MNRPDQEVDIARNVRTIEWLKTEILDGVALLFRAMIKNSEEMIIDSLATIVLSCYFLGKRLGVSFRQLDSKIEDKLRSYTGTEHQLEKWYGDISGLLHYFENKR